jgi:hypothetical protein
MRETLTGLRLGIAGRLLLIVLLEAGNQVGLVSSVRKAPFAEQLLELGNLHRTVVGHGEEYTAALNVAARNKWRKRRYRLGELWCRAIPEEQVEISCSLMSMFLSVLLLSFVVQIAGAEN